VDIWYHPAFRFPISGLVAQHSVEPRRADLVAWYLVSRQGFHQEDFHRPVPISYAKLARVHTDAYLDSLQDAQTLARIFAVDPSDLPVDEVLRTVRLGCGATVAAARVALTFKRPTLNLLGGFHHAAANRGGGGCVVNDIAVAVTDVRARGFEGQIAVLDLDAHPPDGTDECLAEVPNTWVGSISGSHWSPLRKTDETVLPEGAGDEAYRDALEQLLSRMPIAELTFVVAGGDVLAGDPLGRLALSEEGVRVRDLRVAQALEGRGSVWLPAGGYLPQAWRVLAGTALVLSGLGHKRISPAADPLRVHFSEVAHSLGAHELGTDDWTLTQEDLDASVGRSPRDRRFLGYYTREGLELALERYGLLERLRRLGYQDLEVEVECTGGDDRLRVLAHSNTERQLLVEVDLGVRTLNGQRVLFINWLTLRNPRAHFSEARPPLPGQDAPGLGEARETGELFERVAKRLKLAGVAFRPSWFHMAYAARHGFRFLDPQRQGRFLALMRDLGNVPLRELTHAVASGRVRVNGEPYKWEPEEMVCWIEGPPMDDAAAVEAERERVRFELTG
jgi:acetoin utilization deacetylase AcuC-like enzyme